MNNDKLINEVNKISGITEQLDNMKKINILFKPNYGESNDDCLNRLFEQIKTDEYFSDGGVVEFPTGEFILSPFTMPRGVTIKGQGTSSTTLRMGKNQNKDFITFDSSTSAGLKDIRINGNLNEDTGGNGILIKHTKLSEDENSRNLDITNILVSGFSENGIKVLHPAWTFRLDNIAIWYCGGYGIYNEATDNIFSNINIYNCKKGALWNSGANNKFNLGKWYVNGDKDDPNNYSVICRGVRNQYNCIELQESLGNGILLEGAFNEQFTNVLVDSCGTSYTDIAKDRCGVKINNSKGITFQGQLTNLNFNTEQLKQFRGLEVVNSSYSKIDILLDENRIKTPYNIDSLSRNIDLSIGRSIKAKLVGKTLGGQTTSPNTAMKIKFKNIVSNRIEYDSTTDNFKCLDLGNYLIRVVLPISCVDKVKAETLLVVGGQDRARLSYSYVDNATSLIGSCITQINGGESASLYFKTYENKTATIDPHDFSEINFIKID